MQSFLLLLLGLAILGACIWILHRIQMRRTVENADLTAPLDALGESRLPDFAGAVSSTPASSSASVPPAAASETSSASGHVAAPVSGNVIESLSARVAEPPAQTATAVSGRIVEAITGQEPARDATSGPGPAATTTELITSVPHLASGFISGPLPAANDWLAQIRSLRESGDMDAALEMSRAQFPKTQAFQQAAIILRQQIREALEQFQPVDALLRELYHTAALADLFRTSSSHKPQQPQAALAAIRTHAFAYADLGHVRLKLLNKSDVRALEQLWGAPAAHRHAEDVLGEDWLKWCRSR